MFSRLAEVLTTELVNVRGANRQLVLVFVVYVQVLPTHLFARFCNHMGHCQNQTHTGTATAAAGNQPMIQKVASTLKKSTVRTKKNDTATYRDTVIAKVRERRARGGGGAIDYQRSWVGTPNSGHLKLGRHQFWPCHARERACTHFGLVSFRQTYNRSCHCDRERYRVI